MNVLAQAAERRCLTATMTTGPATLHCGPILTPSRRILVPPSGRGVFEGGKK